MELFPRMSYEPHDIFLKITSHDEVIAEVRAIWYALKQGQRRLRQHPDESFNFLQVLFEFILDNYYKFYLFISHNASGAAKSLAEKHKLHEMLWQDVCNFIDVVKDRYPDHIIETLETLYARVSDLKLIHSSPQWDWAKYQGHLAMCRFQRDNSEVWHENSVQQFMQLSDSDPSLGLPYYYLAILRQENHMVALFNLLKSLAVRDPFLESREVLMKHAVDLVTPMETDIQNQALSLSSGQECFYAAISCLILASQEPDKEGVYLHLFDEALAHLEQRSSTFHIRPCAELAILLYLSSDSNITFLRLFPAVIDHVLGGEPDTTDLGLWRFIHVLLVVIRTLVVSRPELKEQLGLIFHPHLIVPFLNMALCELVLRGSWEKAFHSDFPNMSNLESPYVSPLPEDYLMRGLPLAADILREEWFKAAKYDLEERRVYEMVMEETEMVQYRLVRILWTAKQISSVGYPLIWMTDKDGLRFETPGVPVGPIHYTGGSMPEAAESRSGVYVNPNRTADTNSSAHDVSQTTETTSPTMSVLAELLGEERREVNGGASGSWSVSSGCYVEACSKLDEEDGE